MLILGPFVAGQLGNLVPSGHYKQQCQYANKGWLGHGRRPGPFRRITRPCFWEHAERDSKKARLVKLGYLRPAGYSWYEHAKGGLREFFFQCERI